LIKATNSYAKHVMLLFTGDKTDLSKPYVQALC